MGKNTIKMNEAQLRSVVERVIKEAIGRQDSKLANRFIRQQDSMGGKGYATTQKRDYGLGSNLMHLFNNRQDDNGQYEIERSAREIYPLIQKYNAEIKKLQTVYNYLTKRQDGNYTPKSRTARTPMSADQKQRMLASRAANKQQRDAIRAQYGDINDPNFEKIDNGSVGVNPYNKMRGNLRDRNNAVAYKSYGMGERPQLEESIFDIFKRKNTPDEVDQICANYRRIPQPEMAAAAQKVGARLQEYQGIVQQLQGMINGWMDSGKLRDTNAAARAERDAALKNVGRRPAAYRQTGTLEESIDRAVRETLKRYIG